MKKVNIMTSLANIYASMQRESSSKAFIQNSQVNVWEASIEALMTKINRDGIESEDNY